MTTPAPLLGAIDYTETIFMVWRSLGVFNYLFILNFVAVVGFLLRGWLMVGRHLCPFDFERGLPPETVSQLARLVHQGASADDVARQFFAGQPNAARNLFGHYLIRFGRRDRQRPPAPSLAQATDENILLGTIQNVSTTTRFLANVLPALGLLGTLIGMFNAFYGTDFTKGEALAGTMQTLMQYFALALFTTIVAVLLKVAFDLLNHFTVELYVAHLRGNLTRLRTLLYDLLEEPVAAPPPAVDAREG